MIKHITNLYKNSGVSKKRIKVDSIVPDKKDNEYETTQILNVQITFINNSKTVDEIKKLLDADDVILKNEKIFEMPVQK